MEDRVEKAASFRSGLFAGTTVPLVVKEDVAHFIVVGGDDVPYDHKCKLLEWHVGPKWTPTKRETDDFLDAPLPASLTAKAEINFLKTVNECAVDVGEPQPVSVSTIKRAKDRLASIGVPVEEEADMFLAVPPQEEEHILRNRDCFRLSIPARDESGSVSLLRWEGVNIVASRYFGEGGGSGVSRPIMWHRAAVGGVLNEVYRSGYSETVDYYWAARSARFAVKVLQPKGIVRV